MDNELKYFNLVIGNEEPIIITAHSYPRCGDTISIDGVDVLVDKVTWVSVNNSLSREPFVVGSHTVYTADVGLGSTGTVNSLLVRGVIARHKHNSMAGGGKISAIKELRRVAGNLGLKEAKEWIDREWNNV